ncbi:hypothetical protein [Erythrobacter sp. F6033]|uniref:hypothetical protein n=1 Tax=Erythrobacter sp. F6033 TaxID=2926401 RepID=UPI001FF10527|nr:hypothetical protein [Erythrobacter sp. F6033]MCK0127347.1 hypothetical protein [Erythrobacter sp. F6033]
MAKKMSAKKLYSVRLPGGRSSEQWSEFYSGVENMGGKSPDFAGITSVAVIATHQSASMVETIVGSDMHDPSELEIEEITSDTLEDGSHTIFASLIRNYYLPYGDYPSVKEWFED